MVTRTASYTRARSSTRPRTESTRFTGTTRYTREYRRRRSRNAARDRAAEIARAKRQRDEQILNLKTTQLEFLDLEIKKYKASGKRVSARGLVLEKSKAAKRLSLQKMRKDLSVGESDVWYNKFQNYLKPTDQKFTQMNRRLATRPRIAR